jgi:hypothetical protein
MNTVFKLIWMFCLTITIITVVSIMLRLYHTGNLLLFCAGVIALLFLSSTLMNAIFVLFLKGA